MGAESSSADSSSKNNETEVILNIYDLTPVNNYVACLGLASSILALRVRKSNLFVGLL